MSVKTGVYGANVDWVDLGLKVDPFPARPADPSSQAIFAQQEVFSLCDSLQSLHVFTGIAGVGKTTHAKQLAKHFLKNKRRPTQIITASKTIKASGLLKMICCRFNIELPPGDLVDSVKIDSMRRMILKRKEAVALIIDDAQNLSQDALGAIVRLTALQQAPLKLQVVLFGMPILLDRVRKTWNENAVQGDFSQGMIRSWGHSQTEAYIISRLQESGIATSRKICKKVCQKIHQLSGGVPMQINRRASMMLDQLIKGHTAQTQAAPVKANYLWVGALFAATTAAYFSYQAVLKQPQDTLWAEGAGSGQLAMDTPKEAALPAEAALPEAYDMMLEEILTQDPLIPDLQDETVLVAGQIMAEAEEEASPEVQAVDDSLEQMLSVSGGDVALNAISVDLAPTEEPIIALSQETLEASETVSASEDQLAAVEVRKEVGTVETATVSQTVEEWLAVNSGYTVQVMATTDEAEANRVARRYDAARVIHAARQNKEKYLVVVGEFETQCKQKIGLQSLRMIKMAH